MSSYRYPGARSFLDTDLDRQLFRGRDAEREGLLHLVLAERLVVFYGKSGTGKSSLINAGIMEPLRREGFLPLRIRLNEPARGAIVPVFEQVEAGAAEAGVEHTDGDRGSLWRFFKTLELWRDDRLLTPILIFDQFEELFTLHPDTERPGFTDQLSELVRGRAAISESGDRGLLTDAAPEVKIVLSLREDFIGHLEDLAPKIPHILNTRFRLGSLKTLEARRAIEEPAQIEDPRIGTPAFSYAPDTVDRILPFLGQENDPSGKTKSAEVEPFQLQLVCQRVEALVSAKAKDEVGPITISYEDLGGDAGLRDMLERFYDTQVAAAAGPASEAAFKLCEQGLISPRNRRLSLEEGEIERRFGVPKATLGRLVDLRLLRIDPRLGSSYYELSHDTLVKPVVAWRQRRARKRRVRGALLAASAALVVVAICGWWASRSRQEMDLRKDAVLADPAGRFAASEPAAALKLAVDVVQRAAARWGEPPAWATFPLAGALAKSRPLWASGIKDYGATCSAVSPRADRIAAGSKEGKLAIFDRSGTLAAESEEGHGGPVDRIAYNLGGDFIATAAEDRTLRLWDFQGRPLASPLGTEEPVQALAVHPAGNLVALAFADGRLRLASPVRGVLGAPTKSPGGKLGAFTFSPDGRAILATIDGVVRTWRFHEPELELAEDFGARLEATMDMVAGLGCTGTRDGTVVACIISDQSVVVRRASVTTRIPELVEALALSGDGKTLAIALASAHTIKIYGDTNRVERAIALTEEIPFVHLLALNRAADTLAVVGLSEIDDRLSEKVFIFDLSKPRSPGRATDDVSEPSAPDSSFDDIAESSEPDQPPKRAWSPTGAIGAVIFEPDGGNLFMLMGDGVAVWRTEVDQQGRLVPRVSSQGSMLAVGSSDRFALGTATGRIEVWSADGRRLSSSTERAAGITALAMAGTFIVSAHEDDTIAVWEIVSSAVRLVHRMDSGPVTTSWLGLMRLPEPGGFRILRGSPHGRVYSGVLELSARDSFAWRQDADALIVPSFSLHSDGETLELVNMAGSHSYRWSGGDRPFVLEASVATPLARASSADGRKLVEVSHDGSLRIVGEGGRSVATALAETSVSGLVVSSMGSVLALTPDHQLLSWEAGGTRVRAVRDPRWRDGREADVQGDLLRGDGGGVFAVTRDGETFSTWHCPTATRLEWNSSPTYADTGPIRRATISPDGKLIAYSGERGVQLVAARGGDSGMPLVPTAGVAVVEFSPDSRAIAVGDQKRGVAIRTLEGSVESKLDLELDGEVAALRFSPDGRRLALIDGAGRVLLVQRDTGESRVLGSPEADPKVIAFSPDSRYLAIGGDSGIVFLVACDAKSPAPRSLQVGIPVRSLEFAKAGDQLLIGGLGKVVLLDIAGGAAATILADESGYGASFQALFTPGRDVFVMSDVALEGGLVLGDWRGWIERANEGLTAGTTGGSVRSLRAVDPQSELLQAIRSGDLWLLDQLLAAGADPNAQDSQGTTPLYAAALRGDAAMVRLLLGKGAQATSRDRHGITPLMSAAYAGDYWAVSALLLAGANANAIDNNGATALMDVAKSGDRVAVARLLLERGADGKRRMRLSSRWGAVDWGGYLADAERVIGLLEGGGAVKRLPGSGLRGRLDPGSPLFRPADFPLSAEVLREWALPTGSDKTEAVLKTLQKRSEAGDDYAMFLTGWASWRGLGVPIDAARAVEWFRRAAEHGSHLGEALLGLAYWNGEGVEQDLDQAREWIEKAALAKSTKGLIYQAELIRGGHVATEDDRAAAGDSLLEEAADLGDATALTTLGHYAFHAGKHAEAFRLTKLAVEQGGSYDAKGNLGWWLVNGWGTSRSCSEGLKLLREAATTERSAWASLRIGDLHRVGVCVPRSAAEALYWYRLAFEWERETAAYSLAAGLLEEGGPDTHNEAVGLFRLAAAVGDRRAMARLVSLGFKP